MLSATAQETSLGKQCKAKAAEPEAITVVDTIEVAYEGELGMLEDGFKAGGKSCAEASLDENIPKMKDLAAATAPAAVTVASDLSAFYKPSASAVFWSKFAHDHPADGPHAGAIMGALKNDFLAATSGAEAGVTKIGTTLKLTATGGAPLPSIKEFSEEEPVPSASILRSVPMRLTPSRFRCVGRRRLDFLNQGVSRGEPGGERLVCCGVQELAPIS